MKILFVNVVKEYILHIPSVLSAGNVSFLRACEKTPVELIKQPSPWLKCRPFGVLTHHDVFVCMD